MKFYDIRRIPGAEFVLHPTGVPDEATAIWLTGELATGLDEKTGVSAPVALVSIAIPEASIVSGGRLMPLPSPAAHELGDLIHHLVDMGDEAVSKENPS